MVYTLPRVHPDVPELSAPQAVHYSTFTPPPMDGTMTVPDVFDWHAEHSPDHVVFLLSDSPDSETERMTYKDANALINKATGLYYRNIARHDVPARSVVGMFGNPGMFSRNRRVLCGILNDFNRFVHLFDHDLCFDQGRLCPSFCLAMKLPCRHLKLHPEG
jgi:hypothetical protein